VTLFPRFNKQARRTWSGSGTSAKRTIIRFARIEHALIERSVALKVAKFVSALSRSARIR
jgi:hypothetical protein